MINSNEWNKILEQVNIMRKQVISQFFEIAVDMNYMLCIPSVHATYQGEELIVDYCGEVRNITNGFPLEKAELVKKWVSLHENEIIENHSRIGQHTEPLIMIEPLEDEI